jgi:D-glycero-D-manno-heptose 1,7-bisphosphate phosphatase
MASSTPRSRAVFLDRDGVLVPDASLEDQLRSAVTSPPETTARVGEAQRVANHRSLSPGVSEAIAELNTAGWLVVVVTNQPAVARGWITESDVIAYHQELDRQVQAAGGRIEGFFYCPHHPNADLPDYRVACECRKPRPGMLLQAADIHGIDLARSVMVGDRITDIEAGQRAGCAFTILVESGMHTAPRITADAALLDVEPDARVSDLRAAIRVITERFGS